MKTTDLTLHFSRNENNSCDEETNLKKIYDY